MQHVGWIEGRGRVPVPTCREWQTNEPTRWRFQVFSEAQDRRSAAEVHVTRGLDESFGRHVFRGSLRERVLDEVQVRGYLKLFIAEGRVHDHSVSKSGTSPPLENEP